MQIGGKDAFERLKTRRTVVHLVCPRQMALGAPREVRSAPYDPRRRHTRVVGTCAPRGMRDTRGVTRGAKRKPVLSDVETRRMAQKRRAAESAGARREQRRRQKGREGCRHAQKGR